ncbi:MAG: orotidine 5'-phosphate decarboxylase / HUMPS family protein, partial [Candidatus Hadarchaeota archaeon]|nr:orotidine 5'-phosphate decarboxylase / HUMPS family protein [Candidatus Hadarchaeota archaeon]
LDTVRELRREFSDKTLVADMKTMDVGGLEVGLAAEAGADVVSILAVAADETILAAVEAARDRGVRVLADLIAAREPLSRAERVEELGVDYIGVHVGIDQQKADLGPLEQLRSIAGSVGVPIAVAGGLTARTASEAVEAGASIIVVGSAITKARDITQAAREIVGAIQSA